MKKQILAALTTCLVTMTIQATEYHGNRIHAQIDVNPEMEDRIVKILDLIEMGLEQDELYTLIGGVARYSCTKETPSYAVAKNIRASNFNLVIESAVLGSRVTASTSSRAITINEIYNQSLTSWTNTLFHEMLHVIGYGHCGKNDPRFHPKILKSVPYMAGDMMEVVVKKYAGTL